MDIMDGAVQRYCIRCPSLDLAREVGRMSGFDLFLSDKMGME